VGRKPGKDKVSAKKGVLRCGSPVVNVRDIAERKEAQKRQCNSQ
jgi:hypothetical protein